MARLSELHKLTASSFSYADATRRVKPSAIRQLFSLLDSHNVISLAGGFPGESVLDMDSLRSATKQAMSQSAGVAFRYGGSEGYFPLRELIVRRETGNGLKLEARDLVVTTGSQQAIDLVTRVVLNSDDCVAVESPTYLGALQAFRFNGAKVVPVATDLDGISTSELEAVVERHRPKMLYLIPNFGNPTGYVLSLRRRKEILALAARHRFFVVEDNAYGDLYFHEPPPPPLVALANEQERNWVVHISSLSKNLAPGLRLAWMTATPSLLEHVVVAKQVEDTHAATLSQVVAFHYLNSDSFEPALSRMRSFYRKQALAMQGAINAELVDLPFKAQAPTGGMFFWAEVEGIDTGALLQTAIARGVAYVPGAPFYPELKETDRLRLSFASATVEQIGEGIRRLGDGIRFELERGGGCSAQVEQPL